MSKEKNYHDRTVIKNERSGKVDVWHKDSAGRTTKEGHVTYHKNPSMKTNHWGKKVR